MKAFFQLTAALLSVAIRAGADESADCEEVTDQEFLDFANACNSEFRHVLEWKRHKIQYCKSKKIIDELNRKSANAQFEINCFADKSEAEIEAEIGGTFSDETWDDQANQGGGRMLWPIPDGDDDEVDDDERITTNRSINWKTAGKVSEVKSQHHCLSCSLMTGTLVMESRYAIKYGLDPVPLSVQEGVDCTMIRDCISGSSKSYWIWTSRNGGANTEADYPYEDKMGYCGRHTETRQMKYAADYNSVKTIPYDPNVSMVHRLLDYLEKGPIACTMHHGQPCWTFYKSGIVDSSICGHSEIRDHYMTLVGFHHAPADGNTVIGGGDEMEYNRTCRWATDEERTAGRCSNASETMAPNRIGEEDRKCCSYEPIQPLTIATGDGEAFDLSKSYWIVQNSISKHWGQKGLVYIAAEEGPGVSLWNTSCEVMDVK